MLVKIIMAPNHGAHAQCQVFCMHLHKLFSGPMIPGLARLFPGGGLPLSWFWTGGYVWRPWRRRTLAGSRLDTSQVTFGKQ